MEIENFIGRKISELLESAPFREWQVERSVEDDLDDTLIQFVFPQNGVEISCDSAEVIMTIFLHSSEYGGFDDSALKTPFSATRNQVRSRFGDPEKHGEKFVDSILGECGAWDRFRFGNCIAHYEYRIDADAIEKITFMGKAP